MVEAGGKESCQMLLWNLSVSQYICSFDHKTYGSSFGKDHAAVYMGSVHCGQLATRMAVEQK